MLFVNFITILACDKNHTGGRDLGSVNEQQCVFTKDLNEDSVCRSLALHDCNCCS